MKKALLLVSKFGPKNKFLTNYLKEQLGDENVDIGRLSDLLFNVDRLKASVTFDHGKKNLSDYGFVYFRGINEGFYSITGSTALCLNQLNIDYADRIYQNLGSAGDKFTSLLRMSFSDLPVIHSIFCMRDLIEENIDLIVSELGLPLIAKEFVSQHGSGIRTIKEKSDFTKLLAEASKKGTKQFMFQKFINIDKEYRFLVMGDKVRSVQRMYRDTSGYALSIDFKKEEEFHPVSDFSEEMHHTAVKAAKVLNLQVAGVDLAIEKGTGKVFLFEVNRGPGFTYDTNISPEIPQLANFIKERLKN